MIERAETIVARRYRLQEQIGRGGMGVVWRARDERLGRDVALKVLHPWVADDPDLRGRFEREAAALARLEHPNLVRIYDVLESDGQTVLVLELVDGVALDTLIAGRTLDWDEARRYAAPSRRRSRTLTRAVSSTATSLRPTCSSNEERAAWS